MRVTGQPQSWLPRARLAVGVVTLVMLLAVTGLFATGGVTRSVDDLGELTAAALAATNCGLAAWSCRGRLRIGWLCLSLACLSWAVGETIWTVYELGLDTATPFPSLADLGFLGFPLGASAALAVFPSGASSSDRRRMTLDGLIAAAAFALISWSTALGAVVSAGGGSSLAIWVSGAYPVSDIALLVLSVLVLSRSRTHRVVLGCVAAGLAMMAVSDSGFAYLTAQGTYQTGNVVDLGWFLAFSILALSPLTPAATSSQEQAEPVAVAGALLPYVPLVAAAGFLGWRSTEGRALGVSQAALIALIVGLILIRQLLTVRDNQRLAAALAERESQLRHQAFHDGLTGLANRALYVDRVAHALELHRRDRRTLAICFLDLDGFKQVNDTFGHAAGDELLRQAAERFRQVLSDADTLARFGGDEFAVLLEAGPNPLTLAHELLRTLAAPFPIAGRAVAVLASIGVAQVERDAETPSVDDLLTRADVAMYAVKARGKAGVLLHTPGLQLADVDDVALGRVFTDALAAEEITLAFQPIVELATGRLRTLEALARWSPDGLPVDPEVFVRVAERCNLMDPLFRLVLAEACRQLARWKALPGGDTLRVAVNLSPRQLCSASLPRLVAAELARHDLSGDSLVLEIAGSKGLAATTVSNEVCDQLRRLGVGLAVDDFGMGLSSLARLRDLPIDEVKIDRSFISAVDQNAGCARFVRGVLAFAQEVDLTVIAEGVEREEERAALQALGCEYGQGFLFSAPVAADGVAALLAPRAVVPAPRPSSVALAP